MGGEVAQEPSKLPFGGTGSLSDITALAQVPKAASELAPEQVREKVVIVLFTTKVGLSVVKLLYDLACGRVDMSLHKKWQQRRHQIGADDASYKKMVKKWTGSLEYVSTFMDVLLYNSNFALEYSNYVRSEYKLALRNLLDKPNEFLLIDEDYNLLLDFLTHTRPLIEELLNDESLSTLLARVVRKYNRLFEFNGRYVWYTFVRGNFENPQHLFQKYLAVLTDKLTAQQELIPQLQPLFEAAGVCPLPHGSTNVGDGSESDNNSDSDHWGQQRNSAQERVYSFDLNNDGTLDVPNVFRQTKFRHQTLFKILDLHEQNTAPMVKSQFITLCALVDPVTQPTPNDSHIISLDLLSDMFLGFLQPEIIQIPANWKFHVAFNLQKIVNATLPRLNCHDFQKLNSVNNSDDSVDWRKNLHKWLPHGLNTQDLELIYMVDLLAIYTIHKLYQDLPVQMNPFLAPMISLWKNLTFVVLLGLEIDRFEEEQETYNTPVMVRATIRGASALRSVVATILNGHVEYKSHDFKHEPINIFMSPHGRKLCHGALYTDVRSHAAAMLALGIELEDVTSLLSDLQPGDRFDEDVKYMFDYEYDNYNEVDTEDMDEDELEDVESRERIKEMRGYYKRCHCTFDDDEVPAEEDDEGEDNKIDETGRPSKDNEIVESLPPPNHVSISNSKKPIAFRSKKDAVEFDFNGRDWRDIPRGPNLYFSESYFFVDHLYADVIYLLMRKGTEHKLERKHSSFLVRSVATCVRKEQEQTMLKSVVLGDDAVHDSDEVDMISENELTTDFIYERWCEDSLFEKLERHNSGLAWRMMDEMLMCSGYRRVLIWFITHLEVNHSMIQYIFELVMGLRGNCRSENDVQPPPAGLLAHLSTDHEFPFSRQGPIVLSSIEIKMLLQEFFTNAAIFFSKHLRESLGDDEDDDYRVGKDISIEIVGLMKLVCLMVKKLMDSEKFDFTDSEYIFELQTLLMSWICIVPEARDLFFRLRSQLDAHLNNQLPSPKSPETDERDPVLNSSLPDDEESKGSVSEYNERLISLLPPVTDNENTAVTALRSFIGKHSLTTKTAVFGRKVIYQDGEIMNLYMSDNEMNCREFLAEFGIDYNDVVDGAYDDVNENI